MKHETDAIKPKSEPNNVDKPNGDRRRFIVGGLAAAPLLVTLTARPAQASWAQTGTLGMYGSTAQSQSQPRLGSEFRMTPTN